MITRRFSLINRLSVTQKLVLSFVFVIIVGSILLSLPISHYANSPETSYLDHLFNTVSMVCVTGLSVVPVSKAYNGLGQILSMLLMQTGGLGLVSLIAFSTYTLKNKLGLSDQDLLQSALSRDNQKDLKAYLFKVYKITFSIEALAALVIMTDFIPRFGLGHGIFNSLFLAVSAFCNAGFDLFGVSLINYQSDWIVLSTIMLLIIFGGLGFVVWSDFFDHGLKFKKYELHSKIVLVFNGIIILVPAIFYFIFEFTNFGNAGKFTHLPFNEKILNALFLSVSPRTAGFNSLDLNNLTSSGKLLTMILMFIGGSTGSTAGGVKVTTIVVVIANLVSLARGKDKIVLFKRRVNNNIVKQSSALVLAYLIITIISTLVICAIEPNVMFESVLFEVISGIDTVGLSLGLSSYACVATKLILTFLMYVGRLGAFSLFDLLLKKSENIYLEKPEGKVLVG